jgi:hypothetical protein
MFMLLKAQSQTSGDYIILNNNDTVSIQVKVPKELFGDINFDKLYKEVKVLDSTGTVKVFKPTDIKGFHLTIDSKDYEFFAKPVEGGTYKFLLPVIIGDSVSLYQYTVSRSYNKMISIEEFYTFEKPSGEYLFLTNYDKLKTFQVMLKSFFRDKPAIHEFINMRFQTRRDIQYDIKAIISRLNIISRS